LANIEPKKAGSQGGHRACGNQKSAEQVGSSLPIFAQPKILEPLQADPSHQGDQQQEGRNQDGSIEETLKVGICQEPQVSEMGGILAGPKKPRG
jgi:hypothetical protein